MGPLCVSPHSLRAELFRLDAIKMSETYVDGLDRKTADVEYYPLIAIYDAICLVIKRHDIECSVCECASMWALPNESTDMKHAFSWR